MDIINNTTHKLGDDLKACLRGGDRLKVAASCFSIFAFEALKGELSKLEKLEFIFTAPTFVPEAATDEIKRERREFFIPKNQRERSLFGSEFEIQLRNKLTQRAVARECADWIRQKASFRSNRTRSPMQQFICIDGGEKQAAYMPVNGFTAVDLGYQKGNAVSNIVNRFSAAPSTSTYLDLFNQIWSDPEKVEDVTDAICQHIEAVYHENSPERIYFLKRFGWSKFIIMVPSIAIREGVKKSFEITAEHFIESYGKKARFFIYNSKRLHELESFSSDAGINVMIINIQAFAAKGADNRRIYDELDDFQSRRPIDVISSNRPILILDEPQKMEGKATMEALPKFKPLMILRYSATHKTTHNRVHRLDALDAYNQKLVKKIAVRGIQTRGLAGTNAYLYLEGIDISTKAPVARIELEIKPKSGEPKRELRRLEFGRDLYTVSGEMDQYRGFTISQIDYNNDTVEFTNGEVLQAGEATGDVNERDKRSSRKDMACPFASKGRFSQSRPGLSPSQGDIRKILAFRFRRVGPFRLVPGFLAAFEERPLGIVRRALLRRVSFKPRPVIRQAALLVLQAFDFLFVAVRQRAARFKLAED